MTAEGKERLKEREGEKREKAPKDLLPKPFSSFSSSGLETKKVITASEILLGILVSVIFCLCFDFVI